MNFKITAKSEQTGEIETFDLEFVNHSELESYLSYNRAYIISIKPIVTDEEREAELDEYSFDEVAQLLNEKGIATSIWHTGGGCATIYVGEKQIGNEDYYQIAVGPGNFGGRDHSPTGSWSETFVGKDGDEEDGSYYKGPKTVTDLVDFIEAHLKAKPLEEDDIEKIGLLFLGVDEVANDWTDLYSAHWNLDISIEDLRTKMAIFHENVLEHSKKLKEIELAVEISSN